MWIEEVETCLGSGLNNGKFLHLFVVKFNYFNLKSVILSYDCEIFFFLKNWMKGEFGGKDWFPSGQV